MRRISCLVAGGTLPIRGRAPVLCIGRGCPSNVPPVRCPLKFLKETNCIFQVPYYLECREYIILWNKSLWGLCQLVENSTTSIHYNCLWFRFAHYLWQVANPEFIYIQLEEKDEFWQELLIPFLKVEWKSTIRWIVFFKI